MFEKSFIILGFLVVCLQIMASNAGNLSEATIRMSPEEVQKIPRSWKSKFAAHHIPLDNIEAFRSEKNDAVKLIGKNDGITCILGVTYSGANNDGLTFSRSTAVSQSFNCCKGEADINMNQSSMTSTDPEVAINIQNRIKKQIAEQMAKHRTHFW